jgi:hypothetical protein
VVAGSSRAPAALSGPPLLIGPMVLLNRTAVRRVVRIGALAGALLGFWTCGDSGGPTITAAKLTPIPSTNNQAGTVGAPLSVPLAVRVLGASDQPVAGVTVTWTVTSGGGTVFPATSVSNDTGVAETRWTLGQTEGTQTVQATTDGLTATFSALASAIVACGASIDLSVGGVCLADPSRASNMNIGGGAGGAEFVAIPYYDANFTRDSVSVTATATGATTVIGPPSPSLYPSFSLTLGGGSSRWVRDHKFESRLRALERRELRPRVPGARARRAEAMAGTLGQRSATVIPGPQFAVAVGDILTLNANPNEACSNPNNRQGLVVAISANAVAVEDQSNPQGELAAADYQQILADYEQLAHPVNVSNFGQPTDIDGNGKTLMFFTRVVNELTPPNAPGGFVAGFFFSRDLFPKEATPQLGACPASNVAEMFYLLASDTNGVVNNNKFGPGFIKRITVGTIAHEFQHLINSARRLYINPAADWPETAWMEEGLSHIAEELVFYRASGLGPRQNIDLATLRQSQDILDAANKYAIANLSRFRTYLLATRAESPFGEPQPTESADRDDDLETRGAIWSFLRYAADRRGSGDGDVWMRLTNGPNTGVQNLRDVFGTGVNQQLREWGAAHYTDDAVSVGSAALRHPSWNFRSVVAEISSPKVYPLATLNLTDLSPQNFILVDGGAAYLRFAVAANGTATVRFSGGGGNLPAGASVWVIRTK